MSDYFSILLIIIIFEKNKKPDNSTEPEITKYDACETKTCISFTGNSYFVGHKL